MAFTMHSHSGEFCPGHAVDQLEDIIKHAISIGFKTIGLTEHMPRYAERDLYPEELDDPQASLAALPPRHEAYLIEAQRLQALYAPQIHILIGFEAEFIRPEYAPLVQALTTPSCVDYFIGSVHHVHSIPIDYDAATFASAVAASSSPSSNSTAPLASEEKLYEDYYDLQHAMLLALKPPVVGHFDLIRLLSADPGRDVRTWKGVWERILRNLRCAADMGAWLECNSAALRKGLAEPYPGRVIAEEWLSMGGKFTLSDDSHGIGHVATNYTRAVSYLQSLGVKDVWTYTRQPHPGVSASKKAQLTPTAVSLADIQAQFQ